MFSVEQVAGSDWNCPFCHGKLEPSTNNNNYTLFFTCPNCRKKKHNLWHFYFGNSNQALLEYHWEIHDENHAPEDKEKGWRYCTEEETPILRVRFVCS